MREKSWLRDYGLILLTGAAVGIAALVLTAAGNPRNMGFCIACFLRDIAGALNLQRAGFIAETGTGIVQYARPEIMGLVLGSTLIAFWKKEFRPKGGSSPMVRFVIAVFVMQFFINRTRQGIELKAVGTSRGAAEYAGISSKRTILLAMSLSGALAGLAGATYYLGYLGSIQPKVLTTTGFDAIAVCLLGNANPVGILASSFLITIITKGGTYMNSSIGVPQEVSSLITGLMLLFAACGVYIRARLKRAKDRQEQEEKEAQQAKKEGGKA